MWVRFCVASALVLHIQSLGHISEEQIRSPCDQVIEGLRCRATQSCVIPAWVIHSRNLLSSSKKQDSSSGVMARLQHAEWEELLFLTSDVTAGTPCLRITPFQNGCWFGTHLKPAFTGTFIQFWLLVEETFLALNYWGFFCQRFHSWISSVHHPNHSCNPQLS